MLKLVTLILLGVGLLQAQISITSTDLLSLIGHSQISETDTSQQGVSLIVGSAGANQIWDFSALKLQSTTSQTDFLSPGDTPYAANFPSANFVQKFTFVIDTFTSVNYQYRNITSGQFISLGEAISDSYNGTYIDTSYNDVAPLPLDYQNTWQTVTNDTSEFYPGYESITRDSSDFIVDGWGTVKLPNGSFDCLRLRENWYSVETILIYGDPASVDTTFGINYIWLNKDNFVVAQASSMDNETNPNFTQASDFQRLASVVSIDKSPKPGVATNFRLEQNYPNPFNPQTTIRFDLTRTIAVTLDVYALNGRHIARLIDKVMGAGEHSVQFNAENLSSGTYIYRIQSGKFSAIKKMVLIK